MSAKNLPTKNNDQEILKDLLTRLEDGSFLHDLTPQTRNTLRGMISLVGVCAGDDVLTDLLFSYTNEFAVECLEAMLTSRGKK